MPANHIRMRVGWTQILDGCGRLPGVPYTLLEHRGYQDGEKFLAEMRERTEHLLEVMPDHYEYLKELYAKTHDH